MKNLTILLTMIISLTTTHKLYAEDISEKDQSKIEKILDLDLDHLLEYDIPFPDDLKNSIQKLIDDNSDNDIKEKIVETLNSTEMKDISMDYMEDLLLKYNESFDILKEYMSDTDSSSESTNKI